MFKRGRSWYVRLQGQGQNAWHCLGEDEDQARRRLGALLAQGPSARNRLTVADAAQRWLSSYVATRRNERGRELAAVRVKRYLEPFFRYKRLDRVSREDVRAYRQCLEQQGISPQTVAH